MRNSIILISIIGIMYVCDCHDIRSKRQERASRSNPCTTPNGSAGFCYNINQCPSLLRLLQSSDHKEENINFVKRSGCGYDGNDPKVCCPSSQPESTVRTSSANSRKPPTNTKRPSPMINKNGDYTNLYKPPKCGYSAVSKDRIVGGAPSLLGAWPWIAAIGYKNLSIPGAQTRWQCTGSLVTNKHVITAAHCISPTLALVRLGELDRNEAVKDGASPIDVKVEHVLPHADYNTRTFENDIAVLYLQKSVQFNRLIQPICLPKAPELKTRNFEKTLPFAAGWGSIYFMGPSSSRMQEIQIPVVELEMCRKAFERLGANISPKQLCAGKVQGGKDTCQGDSGGPLMWPKQGYFYLIGIVSYGYKCAEPGYPGIYTRTTSYLEWINQNLV